MFRKQKDTVPDATRVPVLSRTDHDGNPLWVGWIQDWVRPAVAVIVLVMSAPGEHFLAHLAGWTDWLAWGMPAVLTMYAGVAAVVATKRPKGAPGKRTAVGGAIASITLAMAAQPIAHLYGSGWQPGNAWTYHQTLTVTISCIPALVFGHLLHLAASPTGVRVLSQAVSFVGGVPAVPQDSPVVPADTAPVSPAAEPVPAAAVPAVPELSPAVVPTAEPVPAAMEDKDTAPVPAGTRAIRNGSMKSFVLEILSQGEDTPDDVIKDMIRDSFGQDTKPNTMNTSIRRARSALAQSA
jgi:hypothetical protein